MARTVTWLSEVPAQCDLCETPITNTFIDGKTVHGPWGIMCISCHVLDGYGFGTGRGQKFEKVESGKFIKTKG